MAIDLSALIQRAGKAAVDNSPAILTALAATGTVATAIFAAKGAFRAKEILDEEDANEAPLKEKVEKTWKCYIPAASIAAMTVVAIVSVNRIGEHRAAALAMGYKTLERAYRDYRDKTVEKVGKNKAQVIEDELAQERADRYPVDDRYTILTGNGNTLVRDQWSGQYFLSDIESIRSSVNDFNEQLLGDIFKSVNDFYDLLGIESIKAGEEFGWNPEKILKLSYTWSGEGANRCLHIDFDVLPISKYDHMH